MTMFIQRIVQTCILLSGIAIASCGQAKEPSRPSILPEIAAMESVIRCVDAAPRDTMSGMNNCLGAARISLDKLPMEPKTVDEFRPLIISSWLLFDRDPRRQLTPASFPKAIDYAKCVETAAYAQENFSSRTRMGMANAEWQAENVCKEHPVSLRALRPENMAAAEDLPERLFAEALANVAIRYALEANGWYPDEMRPCIHYTDGRPPSIGCSLNPQVNRGAPPPPPSRLPRSTIGE